MTFDEWFRKFRDSREGLPTGKWQDLGWAFHDALIYAGQEHAARALWTFKHDPVKTNRLHPDVLGFVERVWRDQ